VNESPAARQVRALRHDPCPPEPFSGASGRRQAVGDAVDEGIEAVAVESLQGDHQGDRHDRDDQRVLDDLGAFLIFGEGLERGFVQ